MAEGTETEWPGIQVADPSKASECAECGEIKPCFPIRRGNSLELECYECWFLRAQELKGGDGMTEGTDTAGKEPKVLCCQCKQRRGFTGHLGDPWCSVCVAAAQAARTEDAARYRAARAAGDMSEVAQEKCRCGGWGAFLDANRRWCIECWRERGDWLVDSADAPVSGTVRMLPPVDERMDKIPPLALLWVGRVLGEGMKYENEEAGTDDWQTRPAAYHLNRMMRHVAQHLAGDTSEDHVGHVMTRALMWGHQLKALDADSAD